MKDFIKWIITEGKGYITSFIFMGVVDYGFFSSIGELLENSGILGVVALVIVATANGLLVYKLIDEYQRS